MFKLSICIPTYNRAALLKNCLQSIISIKSKSKIDFEVCISDNCSTDNTEDVVIWAQTQIQIKYIKNNCNLGMSQNFLNAVQMAEGEFVWMIGDDDLLLPNAIENLHILFEKYPKVDYFYINSFHLTVEYIFSFPQPFDMANIPDQMVPFSSYKLCGEMNFLDLIDPKISFDFLGGIFLSVFRRHNWMINSSVLDRNAISDSRIFSHFDNTFPHLKIFAKAFSNSKAYFCANPLSICLTGAREWSPMQPLVMSVRLIEALDEYKKNGLPYFKYLYCKNFALNNFIPDICSMLYYKKTGIKYVKLSNLIFDSIFYPNFYLSLINFIIRKSIFYSKKTFLKYI